MGSQVVIDDFIGVFENAIPDSLCDELIDAYEEGNDLNYSTNRQILGATPTEKQTGILFTNKERITDSVLFEHIHIKVKQFVDCAWQQYAQYSEKYGVLESVASHRFYDSIKIQKTKPAEGYHVWHCEADDREHGSRLLMVAGYLNDVAEGGETEFLYQSKRVSPKKGTIIICPASFTHTHRGNPPLKGNKYMINGWIEYDS
jgi:hypothetical protein